MKLRSKKLLCPGVRQLVRWTAVICIVAVFSTACAAQAAKRPDPVVVTNTPLPVTGGVSINGTPSVNVANVANVNVANTPAVSVTNTPTVNLAAGNSVKVESGASPLAVRSVSDPAHSFFHGQCVLPFQTPSPSCQAGTVPAGKVLVVESITGSLELTADVVLRPMDFNFQPLAATVLPQSHQVAGSDFQVLVVAQSTRMYFEAGTALVFHVTTGNFPQTLFGTFHVNGYLVDAP